MNNTKNKKEAIKLSDSFNISKMIRFTIPSIVMMIFTSIYGVVDGFFVSNFVGKNEFAAVNFIMPVLMILGAVGYMFGTGGSALVARTLGEGKKEKAKSLFSLFVYVTFIIGILAAVFGFVLLRPTAWILGARGALLENSVLYGRIILVSLPFYMLQFEFQSFFIVAEKPHLGLYVTIIAGVANMVLDPLFMAVFKWGLAGAAIATAISQVLGGLIPLIYFLGKHNDSLLGFTKLKMDVKALLKACANGSSEFVSNISMSVVSMLYNIQLLEYAGEDGIAAYGVLMYVNMIFIAVFIGFTTGIAPVVSFHYGAQNNDELKGLLKKSLCIVGVCSVAMLILGESLSYPLSYIFVGYDKALMDMTLRGFMIYSFSFLFAGFSIYGSGFFTALNDGLVSALISFLRTLVFQVAAVIILPLFLKLDGIWISIVVAEVMSIILTMMFLILKKNKYKYW